MADEENNTTMAMSRHSQWLTVAAFSLVALIALLKSFGDLSDQEKQTKWAASGISIGFGLSGLAAIANMFLRDKFVGTHLEGGMVSHGLLRDNGR